MGQISLTGQALALHNLGTNGLITRTAAGTVAGRTITASNGISITDGDGVAAGPALSLSTPRAITLVSSSVNYLAAVNTYTIIGTLPTGARFVPHDVVFTINTVTGTVGSTDTMPSFRVYNSNSVTALANQITNIVTPFSVTNTMTANQWARSSLITSRATTAAAGETLYLRVETAFVDGNGDYTVLNGKVIVSGFLYT